MNVKITNREVIALHQALLSVGNLRGAKFAYAVGKNQDKTTGILKLLQKTTEPYPEYKDADQARIELCKQFAAKDDKGNPITEQSHNGPQFKIANQADFDTALEAFKESHKDVLAARQKPLLLFVSYLLNLYRYAPVCSGNP